MTAILNTICRGVVGYVSYLATCGSSTVYSEYILYEPILRIAKSQGYDVHCERKVDSLQKSKGDSPRIDFLLTKSEISIALEVKWAKQRTINVEKDVEKLQLLYESNEANEAVLLVFGPLKFIENLRFSKNRKLSQKGKLIKWDAGKNQVCSNML